MHQESDPEEYIESDSDSENNFRQQTSKNLKLPLKERKGEKIRQPKQAQNLVKHYGYASKTSRLLVKTVTLENFKSYKGKQVIGPFDKSLTCVVGPNGSGKSNLLESLIFIFGNRASKMRLKKLQELIHNSPGSEKCKSASVSVEFEEIDETLKDKVVNQFSIKRTVFSDQNGTRFYFNDVETQRENIVELLKSKGVDLNNNRFLILQGEVEMISMMQPKSGKEDSPGLLEYLEDIIGSNIYIKSLEEQELALDEIRKKKDAVSLQLKDVKRDMEGLHVHKEQVSRLFEVEKNIYSLRNIISCIQVMDLDSKTKESEKKLQHESEKLRAIKKILEEEEQKRGEKLQAISAIHGDLKSLKNQIESCESSFNEKSSHYDRSALEIARDQERRQIISQTLLELKASITRLSQEIKDATQELPVLALDLKQVEGELGEFIQQKNLIMNQNLSIIEDLNKKKSQLDSGLLRLQTKIDSKESDMKMCQDKAAECIRMCQETEEQIVNEEEAWKKDKEQAENVIELIHNQQLMLKEGKQMIQHLESKKERNIARKNLLEKERLELESQRASIQESNDQALEQNSVVSQLKQQFGSKVYGQIGQLAAVDKKYDIAITMSGDWRCILVEDDKLAGQCIQYLKEKRIGTANFIALNRIRWIRDKMMKPFIAPVNSQRMFDLVQTNIEEAAIAVYFILRNNLVVDKLETAREIMKQLREKSMIMTLQGLSLQANGSLNGGGLARKGAMPSKLMENDTKAKIESKRQTQLLDQSEFMAKISENNTKYVEVQKKLSKYNSQLITLRSEIKSIPESLEKLQRDVGYLEDSISDRRSKITGMEEGLVQIMKVEYKQANEMIELITPKLKELKKEYVIDEKEQQVLTEKIQQALGSKFAKLEQKIKNLEEKKNELLCRQNSRKGKIDSCRKSEKKSIHQIQKLEKEGVDLEDSIKSSEEKLVQFSGDLEALAELKIELEQKKVELDDKVKSKIKNMKNAEEELVNLIKEQQNVIHEQKRLQDEIGHFQQQKKQHLEQKQKQRDNYLIQKSEKFDVLEEICQFEINLETEIQKSKNHKTGFEANFEVRKNRGQHLEKKNYSKQEASEESSYESEDQSEDFVLSQETELQKSKKKTRPNKILHTEEHIFQMFDPSKDITVKDIKSNPELNLKEIQQILASTIEKRQSIKADDQMLEAYKRCLERFSVIKTSYVQISKEQDEIYSKKDELYGKRYRMFMEGFNFISLKLKECYQELTVHGDADLELHDSSDPFSMGILYSARPPKKTWKSMLKLSGGEKTIASLALIFALHYYKPAPLYFMDEIDAALDFNNVAIVGKFIKERTQNAQFIVISLREQMFSLSSKLIGVFKINNKSKTVQIRLKPLEDVQTEIQEVQKFRSIFSKTHNVLAELKFTS